MKILWMIRGVLGPWFMGLHTMISSFLAFFFILIFKKHQLKFLKWWSGVCLNILGVEVEVEGEENLPNDGRGVILLFNHLSLLDIPILHYALPFDFRFGAKAELAKIPVFGQAMMGFGVLPITRQNRKNVQKLYEQNISKVKSGKSFILAPEGTRSANGEIAEFKSGPFIFAIQCDAPVLPIVLAGVEKIMPKHAIVARVWKHRKVKLRILPIKESATYGFETRKKFKEDVRKIYLKEFSELRDSMSTHCQN